MGGFSSKTQQDLKAYLEKDYHIDNYPLIVHRITKRKAFVHQLTTDSKQQAQNIRRDVNLYKHLACQSISAVLQYVPLQSSKLCSQQQYHYILQQREHTESLKQEFLARKYYKQGFSVDEVVNVIKTYLCGLQVYYKEFRREMMKGCVTMEAVTVDGQRGCHLRMTDPLLMSEHNPTLTSRSYPQSSLSSSLEQTPLFQAPQRIELKKSRFNQHHHQLNQLLADIYIVGIIGLQLYKMELFEQKQRIDQLQNQIQNVKDPQLKNILAVMTAANPEQRKHVYELLQVSSAEIYRLAKTCSQQGNGNNKQVNNNITNHISAEHQQITANRENNFRKETGYSFGATVQQQSHVPPQQMRTLVVDNSKRVINHNFPSNKLIHHQKIQTRRPSPVSLTLPLKLVEKQSVSNMSTERTFNLPSSVTSRTNQKPIVVFNNSNSITSIPILMQPPNTVSTISYEHPLMINKHSTSSTRKIESLLSKQVVESRANSFLFNEQATKLPIKPNDDQQVKKHENFTPISHYQSPQQKNNISKILDQENNRLSQNLNVSPSLYKPTSDKKVQQQISKLLKQPVDQQKQSLQTTHSFNIVNNFSLATQQNSVSSSVHAPQPNQAQILASKEKSSTNNSPSNLLLMTQTLPIYRPNKQVQQILKRLGIGSLLYGEEINQNDKNKKDGLEINNKEKQQPKHNQAQNQLPQVHSGIYRISKHQQLTTSQYYQAPEKDEEVNHKEDNSLTPIKPPKKLKFNSTIVEVGDEDSQYSQNVKNNDQTPMDLTHHQYVVEEYQTGSRYEGYKRDGQRDGEGKFFYQDGGYYEGQWRSNKMHGWGKLYYEGGKLAYQGNWSQDEFHGFGKVYNDNPIQLDCGFDFTNFDLLEDYWEYYEGNLVKDTKEGRGKIMLTNGEMFEGDFHNDRIQGFGKFFMKDGTVIEGIWRDSKLIKIIS